MKKVICYFLLLCATAYLYRSTVLGIVTKPVFSSYINAVEKVDGFFGDLQANITKYANQYKENATSQMNWLADKGYIPDWLAQFASFMINLLSSIVLSAGYATALVGYLAKGITVLLSILFA